MKMLVRELGRRTAVNNDCLNAQEISDTVIAGCNMGQICPQGQHRINQHPSNHTSAHTHTHAHKNRTTASQINLILPPAYLIEENRREGLKKKKEGQRNIGVYVRKSYKRSKEGKGRERWRRKKRGQVFQ